ncbi:LysR family transcriptional regulator [Jannaschia sp. CCS1]|uniref:LysR family transcriptional regulator n=1 Tax=Jannaschia sp. (strain CCS1) TaxID=290400 RepID=UPI000053CE9D|nr:LysR family transcriptional regulator [Jannaschia sp. CCS1]ABD54234.1 transcriptional regulator, LysR family [Jannaschia sp. CCS1]
MRTPVGLDDLRYFYLVAEAGGVSAAARRFDISKATLSRAVARLEDQAKGPLFDRLSTGLQLTQAGEALIEAARQATDAGSTAEELLRTVTEEPQGMLRIAASALSGQYLVGPVLARLTEDYPKVTAHVSVTASGPDPLAEELDLVLRLGRPEEPYLIARRIIGTPMKLYCGTDFAKSNPVTDPEAVSRFARVSINVPGAPANWLLHDDADRTLTFDIEPRIYAGDPTVAIGLVHAGAGITLLPALYGDLLVERGDAAAVLPTYEGAPVELFAVFPPRRSSVPAVRVFIDYLTAFANGAEKSFDRGWPG